LKDIGSNGPLFQVLNVPVKFLSHHILEELPATRRAPEASAGENFIEFLEDRFSLLRIFREKGG
jgi:hypothetical protein